MNSSNAQNGATLRIMISFRTAARQRPIARMFESLLSENAPHHTPYSSIVTSNTFIPSSLRKDQQLFSQICQVLTHKPLAKGAGFGWRLSWAVSLN